MTTESTTIESSIIDHESEVAEELTKESEPEVSEDREPEVAEELTEDSDLESWNGKTQKAVDAVEGLLERMGLEAHIERVVENERIEIELTGEDAGRVIGKKGQTLDALQFIVNKVVNRFPEGRRHVILDVEGYKGRRDESLRDMAHRLAEKASRTGKVITVTPMPSRERRVIHLALADVPGVSTRSDGQGTDRRVRIIPSSARRRSSSRSH